MPAMKPTKGLAVVACMDCRLDVRAVLDIGDDEAHIIRNGGGVITDDVIRSLCLSQRSLGTRTIALVHHTDCGLEGLDPESFYAGLEAEVGVRPSWELLSFEDAADDVRASIRMLEASPFVPHTDDIQGYVYDVASGDLRSVD